MGKRKKSKQVTFRVWRDAPRGDDTARSIRGIKPTARHALMLHRRGQLNSVMVATGRSLLSERPLNKTERKKLNLATKKMASKKPKRIIGTRRLN